MKLNINLYGLTGLLSLIGLIGVFSPNRVFLAFFAFAVDFQYLFMQPDEMLRDYMNKSASRAFYWGMATTALVSLGSFLLGSVDNNSFIQGVLWGWTASVVVHGLSSAYYGVREAWGTAND